MLVFYFRYFSVDILKQKCRIKTIYIFTVYIFAQIFFKKEYTYIYIHTLYLTNYVPYFCTYISTSTEKVRISSFFLSHKLRLFLFVKKKKKKKLRSFLKKIAVKTLVFFTNGWKPYRPTPCHVLMQ